MNKEEVLKRLEELQKEVEALKKIVEAPERWQDRLVQPREESYLYIGSDNVHGFDTYAAIGGASSDRKPEYAFRTKEQAELVKEKMLLMQEMLAFAHVRNEGWKPDWDVAPEEKHGIKIDEGVFLVDYHYTRNAFVFGVSVKNQEIAEEMLEIFGERIKKYYNQQY